MKIKCVRCGVKSSMALCPDCQVPHGGVVSSKSFESNLPSISDLKGGLTEVIDETKVLIAQGRQWIKGDMKRYTTVKNWNIAFDKGGALTLAKDTVLAILPLIIAGFIAAKIFISMVDFPSALPIPAGTISKAVGLWILNLAMGVGVSVTGSATVLGVGASAGGTVRVIASGLTLILIFLLVRKSRSRAREGNFTLNPQSEILGTSAVLALVAFFLTSLTGNDIVKTVDVNGLSLTAGGSVSVDIYSLLYGPLIISTIAVLLGSYSVKNQKKISETMDHTVSFFMGTIGFAAIAALFFLIKERDLLIIPAFIVAAPTAVLVALVAASGVPLINSDKSGNLNLLQDSTGNPVDLLHPSPSLGIYVVGVILTLILIGGVMGFRMDPRSFTARSSWRVALAIVGATTVLNFFLMFYAFGDAGSAFGDIGSKSMAVLAHPLYLIPASLIWAGAFISGARYLTPFLAEYAPTLASTYLPKVRLNLSEYYKAVTLFNIENLSPLEKQTKAMKVAIVKGYSKKVGLVAAAIFIVLGPANNTIAQRLSSPESAVENFYSAMAGNDAGGALSHVSFDRTMAYDGLLTDAVLKGYESKPTLVSIEIEPMEKSSMYADARIKYSLDGDQRSVVVPLVRDTTNKLYKIFPVWKVGSDALRVISTSAMTDSSTQYAGVSIPKGTTSAYLFPGIVNYKSEDDFYLTEGKYEIPLDPYSSIGFSTDKDGFKDGAAAAFERRVRASVQACNQDYTTEDQKCPRFNQNGYPIITVSLDSVLNLSVSYLNRDSTGEYSFYISMNGTLTYRDNLDGPLKTDTYNITSITGRLSPEDGYQSLRWSVY